MGVVAIESMLRLLGRPAARTLLQRPAFSSVAQAGLIKNEHAISYPEPQIGVACTVFRSDAEARIAEVPVIEVDGDMAYCDGGGGAMGHPVENIQLNLKYPGSISVCKYCGLRFKSKAH